MRALIFDAPGRVAMADVVEPTLLDAGDVLVATEVAGLCGSDLHVYRGLEPGLDPGTPMGHELLGTIVAAGARGVRVSASAIASWRRSRLPAGPAGSAIATCPPAVNVGSCLVGWRTAGASPGV